jgi:DNA-binding transcriptional ArsR family regulator
MEALGDRTRRQIFEQLANGPCAVGLLALRLPVTRPAVSQHLRVLKNAGLVMDLRIGNRRLYRVNVNGVAALRAYFDDLCLRVLESSKQGQGDALD